VAALSDTGPAATPSLPGEHAPAATEAEQAASGMPGTRKPPVVLDIRDLKTYFYTYDGVVKALDGVSFKIRRTETVGLVGETGCGKSVTAFSVTGLIPDPPGRIVSGHILFRGADLLWGLEKQAKFKPVPKTNRVKVVRRFRMIKAAMNRMSAVRGSGISMIFQEPTQAMNPIFSVSNQLAETILLHTGRDVIDQLMASTPDAPEVVAALERLTDAAGKGSSEDVRSIAVEVGTAANLATVGTQAYYLARAAGPMAAESLPEFKRALRRLHLRPLQRAYMRHQRALLQLHEEQNEIYLSEMRNGKTEPGRHRAIRRRRLSLSLRGLHYKLWGIRGMARKPLNDELFWRSVRLLEGVSIANPVQVARSYPHELSGGMLQRVMIAMALSTEPDILFADEPTTALDVTIQAQILELMLDLKHRVGTAILLITHDLAVIAEVADRVCVMYAGQIVESAAVRDLFRRPLHPYAQGLLASIPRIDQPGRKLESIPGSVPNLIFPPTGCRFHPRCPYAMPICKESRPPTTVEGEDHTVACFLYKGPVAVE
jgi:peptide/nickel transport system ATP-binding protein